MGPDFSIGKLKSPGSMGSRNREASTGFCNPDGGLLGKPAGHSRPSFPPAGHPIDRCPERDVGRTSLACHTSFIILSNSSTDTAGEVAKEIPVILAKATEAFMAWSIPGKVTIKTKSLSPKRAYMAITSPPNFLMRFTAFSVRAGLISLDASWEYFPNIIKVAISTSPFWGRLFQEAPPFPSDACQEDRQGNSPGHQSLSLSPLLLQISIGIYESNQKDKRLPQGSIIPPGSLRRVPSGFSCSSFPLEGLRLGNPSKFLRQAIQ